MICRIVIFPRLRVAEHCALSSAVSSSFDGSFPGVRRLFHILGPESLPADSPADSFVNGWCVVAVSGRATGTPFVRCQLF